MKTVRMWSSEYSVGNAELDAQHEHVMKLVTALEGIDEQGGAHTADVLLEHIARFLEWHFATEESLMSAGGYPMLDEHRTEHRRCSERLAEFHEDAVARGVVNHVAAAEFLARWLERHTLEVDRKYILYVGGRQLEASPAHEPK